MAYDFFGLGTSNTPTTLTIDGPTVDLPDASYITDGSLVRDGMDLVLEGPNGSLTIDGYFAAESAPTLSAPNGLILSPQLVESFVQSNSAFAQSVSMNDESPVGAVNEITGEATITRLDGSVEVITQGTPVFEGDVVETSADGAVNISFIDETSFAVSQSARLAIDEYVYDPATESGSQNFSVLKGVFVFTSGLIGRDDPDDVNIDTPSGSIGIRGTIIAGNVDNGEITVVEGAIVVRDNFGNEVTLDDQFETARIDLGTQNVVNLGQLPANDVNDRFISVSNVAPTLFSSIEDAAAEQNIQQPEARENQPEAEQQAEENFDADGTVDQDNDNAVDGTIDEGESSSEDGSGAPEPKPLQNGELGTDPLGETKLGAASEDVQIADSTQPIAQQPGVSIANKPGPSGPAARAAKAAQRSANQDEAQQNQDLQDPTTIVPPPPGSGSLGPVGPGIVPNDPQFSTIPNEAFATTSNQIVRFDVSGEFFDPTPGDVLTYSVNGAIPPQIDGINFIGASSILLIDTGNVTADQAFSFQVTATDSTGQSVTKTIDFDLVNTVPTFDPNGANQDSVETIANLTIGGANAANNNTVFFTGVNNDIVLQQGSNNKIYLGEGSNQITIATATSGNEVYGGSIDDTFIITNGQNELYGLGGDDVFTIDLSTTSTIAGGGVASGGTGVDTIFLQNSGALDFAGGTVEQGAFRGIERIDASAAGTNAVINLNVENVFDMTDFKDRLIIRADGGDTIQLAGFNLDQNDVNFDDGTGTSNFDVYKGTAANGREVTLLVEDTGASII